MDYYLDIKILSNDEISESFLMNSLFSFLHNALVTYGKGDVGVSFPEFKKKLGRTLRLHGSLSSIIQIARTTGIEKLEDYLVIGEPKKVPQDVQYRVVKRVQIKSNPERLLRRSVRKGWLTAEEALVKLNEASYKKTALPYLTLKSSTTKQWFQLFIDHGELLNQPKQGIFSSYGLSTEATIPWF